MERQLLLRSARANVPNPWTAVSEGTAAHHRRPGTSPLPERTLSGTLVPGSLGRDV